MDKTLAALAAVAAALAGTAPLAAQAQDTGAYIGASIGQGKDKDACDDEPGVVVTSCDDKATAWKIFFGYRFHRNFAGEVTYMQAGDYAAAGTYLGVPISVKGDDRSVGIAALGIWPVSPAFELFGKLGILSTRSELTGTVGGIPGSASETESEAHYGLGAVYKFTPNWGLRAEWERGDKGKVDTVSLGAQYKF